MTGVAVFGDSKIVSPNPVQRIKPVKKLYAWPLEEHQIFKQEVNFNPTMQESKQWYVVYTKPGREKKVAEALSRKKIENYCPLQTTIVTQFWNDQKVEIRTSLFNSFVFVKILESEFERLKETAGVINFLYRLNKPAVIDESEIDTIRQFLKDFGSVRSQKMSMNVNNGGQLADASSLMLGDRTQRTVTTIVLPSLGYSLMGMEESAVKESMRFAIPKPDYSYFNYAGALLRNAGERLKQVRYKFFHAMK